MRMPWLDSLTLGYGGMDDDHRHMFDLMNELNASVSAGNLSGVRVLFEELHATTLRHLAEEEALMVRCDYPAAAEHADSHEQARRNLMVLQQQVADSNLSRVPELLAEYAALYFRSILKDDELLVRFLRGRGEAP